MAIRLSPRAIRLALRVRPLEEAPPVPLSPYTFQGAIDLLDPDRRTRSVLDKVFGTALFAGTATAAATGGPIAGMTAAAWLALADPKNEAVSLLTPLVSKVTQLLRDTKTADQLQLIAAAHTVTVVSSFFDSVSAVLGEAYRQLELTDAEKNRLIAEAPAEPDRLLDVAVPLSSPRLGLDENIDQHLRPYYQRLSTRCRDFFTGLEAWGRITTPSGWPSTIVDHSVGLYRSRMLELAPSEPFALWLTLNEIAATRHEARRLAEAQTTALGDLQELLSVAVTGTQVPGNTYRRQLTRVAQEVLDEPLLRSRLQTVASPTVRDGFVEPAFRHAVAEERSRPTDEDWWSEQPEYSSLVDFLAGYLASPSGTLLPLLLLGHPGAGKSLLTEVLAAQLPAESFVVVRIPLRSVNPDDDLPTQIDKELRRVLQRPGADLDSLREECAPCAGCRLDDVPCTHQSRLVVLLDGFDELIQATGMSQSAYLTKIATFMKRERTLHRPTAVVVTSRTVVADRAEIPPGTRMIKLLEFDTPRIEAWLTAWNAAHAAVPDFAPLDVAALTASQEVADLARQPLLLLMLAVYLAELGTGTLGPTELTQSELYERILDRFISRQVTEKAAPGQDADEQGLLRRQQRRRLQYAAFGMFNRGRQHISDAELDADLAALEPTSDAAPRGQALSAADRVLGEFMFVHNARADREQLNAYEFLHATFGEFLVAELVVQLLTQLMRHRELEAALPHPGGLDDQLLRRLLSHQPLSTRQPILDFVCELGRRLPEEQQAALFATTADLLQRELTRPDLGDHLYTPVPYDPVRHRACYTANLTLLRVDLDYAPVPVKSLVGPLAHERWRPLVHLWRAGMDVAAWFTVMETLGVDGFDEPRPWWEQCLCLRRSGTSDPAVNEAELLGDRGLQVALMIGGVGTHAVTEPWREADLLAMTRIAIIHFGSAGTPHFARMLPYDNGWYAQLLEALSGQRTINGNVKRAIVMLLSRAAPHLPRREIAALLAHAFPPPTTTGYEVELAAITVCHPALLDEVPGLREHLYAVDPEIAPTVVALFWRAEQNASGGEREALQRIRLDLDRQLADGELVACAHTYFTPEFLTYLRVERPAHWTSQHAVPRILDELDDPALESIAPEDALYVATTWRQNDGGFLESYLGSRGVRTEGGDDQLAALREYAKLSKR
ncbi:NACHT domain-containing protein [Kribbella sp. GL6]|uniref:NACHT domain-containing protein n=1 Tax=Kribbella sp. GL6 TaxID=3419765 RepID=UPI003CFCFA22